MDELNKVARQYIQQGQRAGQAYSNALSDLDWYMAKRTMEDGVDPFYDDDLLPQFFEYLRDYLL